MLFLHPPPPHGPNPDLKAQFPASRPSLNALFQDSRPNFQCLAHNLIPTYSNLGASGAADHLTLSRLFFFSLFLLSPFVLQTSLGAPTNLFNRRLVVGPSICWTVTQTSDNLPGVPIGLLGLVLHMMMGGQGQYYSISLFYSLQ